MIHSKPAAFVAPGVLASWGSCLLCLVGNPALYGGTERHTHTQSVTHFQLYLQVLGFCLLSLCCETAASAFHSIQRQVIQHHCAWPVCCLLCCIVLWTHGKPQPMRRLVLTVDSGRICQLPDHPIWRITLKGGEAVQH